MPLTSPPTRIVSAGSVRAFGMYRGAIGDPNLQDARVHGPLGRLRYKQWQHLAVVGEQIALSFAVVDTGYLRLGWLQLVDRSDGTRVEHGRKAPWLDLHVAERLGDDHSWLRTEGLTLELHSHLDAGCHSARLEAPDVHVELVCEASAEPLEVVLPVGRGRAMWSHKVPVPVSGTVRWRGRDHVLDPARTTGLFDIHKAHYPYRTWWHWGTFAWHDAAGRRLAVNLTRNVVPDPTLHECALWVDGRLELLEPPTFAVDADPWTARGPGVDVRFDGEGERHESLDVGLLQSRFRQRYGLWSGQVGPHHIQRAWGLAEDHHSRW